MKLSNSQTGGTGAPTGGAGNSGVPSTDSINNPTPAPTPVKNPKLVLKKKKIKSILDLYM